MFFNTDILYRNGPLALVWLAGNGDAIMKSGPTRSKYKTDIMGADLHRLIEMIFEQLPSVGCSDGLSLKKIVCLFHGIVVIHHMQLDASLKRLNQLYQETCKIRDLMEDENEIDTVARVCKNLVPKIPKGKKLLNTSSDFQMQVAPGSPRALPQPLESETLGFGELTDFEDMLAEEIRLEAESRRIKRKEGNVDSMHDIPAKVPRQLECITDAPLDIRRIDSEGFEDWNWNIGAEEFPPVFDPIVDDTAFAPPVVSAPILEEAVEAVVTNRDPITENFELELERRDINTSPQNRQTTNSQNLLALRPIRKEDVQGKQRRRPKCLVFNEETELSAETISRQAKASLGIDGFGAQFFELQNRASSLHALAETEYLRSLKGLKCIENSGRKTGVSLSIFQNNILSNLKNYHREATNISVEVVRAAEDTNTSKDSRTIATRSLISPNISGANEAENIPPLKTPQPVEQDMMEETVAGQDIQPDFPDQVMPPMEEDLDVLRQDMVLFSAKFPPNKTYMPKECSDTSVDEKFLLAFLKNGRAVFSEIFPPSKFNRLQAAQGMMLLLRMQGEKKVVMMQHAKKNDDYAYEPISVRLLNAK